MLTEKQFEGLKKTNLSIDADKSRERISGDFKSAAADLKKKIVALSGLTKTTFYNAFQKGTASPKMVLAMAQSLGVSPYYYTGETDEKGAFDTNILKSFLSDKDLKVTVKRTAKGEVKSVKAEKKVIAKKPIQKTAKTSTKQATVKAAKTKPVKSTKNPAVKPIAKTTLKSAKTVKQPKESNEVLVQISIEKTAKLQKAVANLDEETAVLLLRALFRKADSNDNAKAVSDVVKCCLLS